MLGASTCCETKDSAPRASAVQYYQPDVDVHETEAEVVLTADIPGSVPENISIEHENGELTIKASVAPRESEGKALLQEYGVADFYRSFQLGEGLDVDSAKAEYADGVLRLSIPKSKTGSSKKIAISSH